MAEGSESSSGRKKQLGAIYRERNLGRLITKTSDHEERGENIDNSDDQANHFKSFEGESSTKPRRNIGKLWKQEEKNIAKSVDQTHLSESTEGKSKRLVNTIEEKTKTDGAEATLRSNAQDATAIVLFDEESGFLQRFDPRNNSLTKMHEMTEQMKLGASSSVSLGDYIYVLNWNRSVYRLKYSDKTATWERMSDTIENHGYWPPAAAYSESIYVVGGSGTYDSCVVEKYDSVTNQWTRLQDKPQSTRDSGVLASRRYIYCFGGEFEEGGYQKSVQRLRLDSTDSATWQNLPPINEGKADMAVIEFRKKRYVMGGLSDGLRRTNERYDPLTKEWAMIKPMIAFRWRFRCFAIDECIYAVGGDSSSNTIEKYDVEEDEWEMVDLPRENKLNILDSVIITLHD